MNEKAGNTLIIEELSACLKGPGKMFLKLVREGRFSRQNMGSNRYVRFMVRVPHATLDSLNLALITGSVCQMKDYLEQLPVAYRSEKCIISGNPHRKTGAGINYICEISTSKADLWKSNVREKLPNAA